MSRRVAIRKMPPLGALALAAGKLVGRGLLAGGGFGAGKKLMEGGKEKDTQQQANQQGTQQEANPSFTDKVQERGEKAADAGAAYAQAQQASQQQMEQRGQQMAEKAKAGSQIATGEAMDMAWRMLKGELQLPHQITEALRGDLTTLDRAHKMTDTNEGTLIEGIHPDMENVVKLLAEKHLGDMTPTMQRPVMPLFHGPFH